MEKFPTKLDMSNIAEFPVHQGKGLSQIKEYVSDGTFSDIEKMKAFKTTLESEDDNGSGSGSGSGAVHNGNGDEDGGGSGAVHDGNGDEDGEEKDEAEENGDEDVGDSGAVHDGNNEV